MKIKKFQEKQELLIRLMKISNTIQHLKELRKHTFAYKHHVFNKKERIFLKYFDKLTIDNLCKKMELHKSAVYEYFKKFDKFVVSTKIL